MILYINTCLIDRLEVSLKKDNKLIVKKNIKAKKSQAEKLLMTIDKVLDKANLGLKDISEIKVANHGGSFTGLRIGVLTANSLAYALEIPVSSIGGSKQKLNKFSKQQIVKAIYDRDAIISKNKKNCV